MLSGDLAAGVTLVVCRNCHLQAATGKRKEKNKTNPAGSTEIPDVLSLFAISIMKRKQTEEVN